MATDLRVLISTIHLTADLERMGDLAHHVEPWMCTALNCNAKPDRTQSRRPSDYSDSRIPEWSVWAHEWVLYFGTHPLATSDWPNSHWMGVGHMQRSRGTRAAKTVGVIGAEQIVNRIMTVPRQLADHSLRESGRRALQVGDAPAALDLVDVSPPSLRH